MIAIRKADARGHANHGWLDSYHTFSFAGYFDPKNMGFGPLRVINEDRVKPGKGFGAHPHDEMEIITYIVDGELEHQDSIGTGSVIRRGEVQRMSAGTGIVHSEFNPSQTKSVHLLQIWILPGKAGIQPSYDQKMYSDDDKRNRLKLIATPQSNNGTMQINQDVSLYASILESGNDLEHTIAPGRTAWVQLIQGEMSVNGKFLDAGDGAAIRGEEKLTFSSTKDAEFLLFDMVPEA